MGWLRVFCFCFTGKLLPISQVTYFSPLTRHMICIFFLSLFCSIFLILYDSHSLSNSLLPARFSSFSTAHYHFLLSYSISYTITDLICYLNHSLSFGLLLNSVIHFLSQTLCLSCFLIWSLAHSHMFPVGGAVDKMVRKHDKFQELAIV